MMSVTAILRRKAARTRFAFCGLLSLAVAGAGAAGFLAGNEPLGASVLGVLAIAATIAAGFAVFALSDIADRPASEPTEHVDANVIEEHALARLQSVVDGISDGFVLWDSDGRLVLHNRQATRRNWPDVYKGMTFDQYVNDVFPYLDEQSTGGNPEAWLEQRKEWLDKADGTHEVRTKGGVWTLLTERHIEDGGTVTTYTDITKAKDAHHARAVSERRLVHAQRLARLGIFEWDARKGEMYWSDIMYEIVGLQPESPPLDFAQYLLLVRPESRDLVRSTFRRLLTTGGKYNQEYEIVTPDGEIRAVRAEAEAVQDDSGEVIRILGSVHDQTRVKRVENALRQAKEAAVAASTAKSEFLANVSHELRTPLNAIIGFSEVMLQEVFGPVGSERYRDYAGDIRQSGVHLLGVINDLLDFSKLEAGRTELHIDPVAPDRVVDKCVRMMRQRADAENVALVAQNGAGDLTIAADEQKVTQIVLNLISNAIKFTPDGGVVTVATSDFGEGAEIRVSDTGIGMSSKDIDLALAPFGQVDSSLNRQYTGTGLGLPLSKSLAELHGGTLHIESAPGQGTTISVRLPNDRPEKTANAALRLVSEPAAG